MIKYKVTLSQKERDELMSITKGGKHSAKKIIHSIILLNCDEGKYSDKVANEEVAQVLKIGPRTIDRVKRNLWKRVMKPHWRIARLPGSMNE
jgi:DNA-binding CsgD family transcriptional regulator